MTKISRLLIGLVLGFWPASACAEPLQRWAFAPLHPVRMHFDLDLGHGGLDPAAAKKNQVSDSGFAFGATLGLEVFDLVTVSGFGGTIFVEDFAPFEEDVVEVYTGEESRQESSLNVNLWGVAIGPRTPAFVLAPGGGENGYLGAWLAAVYGVTSASASRSIDSCNDCRSDELELSNGTYLDVAAYGGFVGSPLGVLLKTSYRHFLSGSSVGHLLTAGFAVSWF